MHRSPTSTGVATRLRRKKFLGVTMSLLFLDSVNQGLAHSTGGAGWAPIMAASTNPLPGNARGTNNVASAIRGQSLIPISHQTSGQFRSLDTIKAGTSIQHTHGASSAPVFAL